MLDFSEDFFEELNFYFQETKETFEKLWEEIQKAIFTERDPIPETPYIFRNQSRVYDKRPHKQHRCRNNC